MLRGYGHEPHFVEGDDPALVHQALARALDTILAQIRQIQSAARALGETENPQRPRWPMIVLRTPKGWTGPKFVDGKPVEGTWRARQVPIAELKTPEQLKQLEDWLLSYRPREHPHGLEDHEFDALFTTDKPVIFAFHGYPAMIHKLTYRRRNHGNIHVRGYKEEGTTTTASTWSC